MKNMFETIKFWLLIKLDLIRYDIPNFLRNLWVFRRALWTYIWYQGEGSLFCFMEIALRDMADNKEKLGHEIDSTSNKKVAKMRRASQIINLFQRDGFIELAEQELGPLADKPLVFEPIEGSDNYRLVDNLTPEEKEHQSKVFDYARELEEKYWEELWIIFKGQNYEKFSKKKSWDDQFDGSGLRGWWD